MTTYYVDGAVGNDANAGTSEGAGNAWATIDHAMSTVNTNDTVYIKASATYSETPNIDRLGGAQTPIVYEGYSETPGDNGKITISGTTNCLTSSVAGINYSIFKNIIFTGASGDGAAISADDRCTFFNCEFTNNGGHGLNADSFVACINCIATGNTSDGFNLGSNMTMLGCIAANNGGTQINGNGHRVIYKTLAYGQTSAAPVCTMGAGIAVIGNTIDGDGVGTWGFNGSPTFHFAVDNIIHDVTNGIGISTASTYSAIFTGYNLMSSVTTDYPISFALTGIEDVSGAPSFTDEAGDDYTLGESSPAIDAGVQPGVLT